MEKQTVEQKLSFTKSFMETREQRLIDDLKDEIEFFNKKIEKAEKDFEARIAQAKKSKSTQAQISVIENERDQRLKQLRDNIASSVEGSVDMYMGNLRIVILGKEYASGEPPKRTTKG
ncbi:MAG: hypothetical protein IJ004_01225 [Clostridia bacterium]|nr:hypothetical protein [Clostridia bacterium]